MINRWVSMYSPNIAEIINHTTNRLFPIFETKKDNYKFLLAVLPKCNFRRIRYIKKVKRDKEDDAAVQMIAKNLELSKREINYYITSNNIDIEKHKKICHST